MFEGFSQIIEKIVTDLTPLRIKVYVSLMILFITGFFLFENYTDYFKLARLNNIAEVLGKIKELDKDHSLSSDVELSRVILKTKTELEIIVSDIETRYTPKWKWLLFILPLVIFIFIFAPIAVLVFLFR